MPDEYALIHFLIFLVGFIIIIASAGGSYTRFRERLALEAFFERLERKGINPREFIRPSTRIYHPMDDPRVVRQATLVIPLAIGVTVVYYYVSDSLLRRFLSTGDIGAILLPLVVSISAFILYGIYEYIQEAEVKALREDRLHLISRFVFSLDVSRYFVIDENAD